MRLRELLGMFLPNVSVGPRAQWCSRSTTAVCVLFRPVLCVYADFAPSKGSGAGLRAPPIAQIGRSWLPLQIWHPRLKRESEGSSSFRMEREKMGKGSEGKRKVCCQLWQRVELWIGSGLENCTQLGWIENECCNTEYAGMDLWTAGVHTSMSVLWFNLQAALFYLCYLLELRVGIENTNSLLTGSQTAPTAPWPCFYWQVIASLSNQTDSFNPHLLCYSIKEAQNRAKVKVAPVFWQKC